MFSLERGMSLRPADCPLAAFGVSWGLTALFALKKRRYGVKPRVSKSEILFVNFLPA